MLKSIRIDKISPHPDNPRKDLGDITELADSIKVNGILQNLTVVPYIGEVTGEVLEGTYRVVIGHRRLAAAKIAGLTEVPCVIVEMDIPTQVSTMLLENMQRNDLTIYEQAQGFQMMLDLGVSIAEIKEKTGFSDSTVRRRVKLLEFDQEKFKVASERGANLMDFAELDKIEDLELKNQVLESIGTPNFKYVLQSAMRKEERNENKQQLISELEKFASPVDTREGLREIRYLYTQSVVHIDVPDDLSLSEYFYKDEEHYIILLKRELSENKENDQQDEYSEEDKERARQEEDLKRRRAELDQIKNEIYQLRVNFILEFSQFKKFKKEILEFVTQIMIDYSWNGIDESMLSKMLNLELDDEELNFKKVTEACSYHAEKILLIAAYCVYQDSIHESYFDYFCRYRVNEELEAIYGLIEKIGYQMSDVERQIRNGSHELYVVNAAG